MRLCRALKNTSNPGANPDCVTLLLPFFKQPDATCLRNRSILSDQSAILSDSHVARLLFPWDIHSTAIFFSDFQDHLFKNDPFPLYSLVNILTLQFSMILMSFSAIYKYLIHLFLRSPPQQNISPRKANCFISLSALSPVPRTVPSTWQIFNKYFFD